MGYITKYRREALLLFIVYFTLVQLYACDAVHSALLVGLLSAKMIGRSLKDAMSLQMPSENAPATAATPSDEISRAVHSTISQTVLNLATLANNGGGLDGLDGFRK